MVLSIIEYAPLLLSTFVKCRLVPCKMPTTYVQFCQSILSCTEENLFECKAYVIHPDDVISNPHTTVREQTYNDFSGDWQW